MNYRREIDGLRAIAVVPVILFHANLEMFSGGFVGVDIFFVISGYLITTLIIEEHQQGTFSILNFYERRARRILPALFLVVLVCVPLAWLWMRPSAFSDFSRSLIAVSIFLSNIEFGFQSGYFGTAAEYKPLLHTWSLAVEEQFYLFFPVFLLAVWKFRRDWLLFALLALGLTSLIVAEVGSAHWPRATFFLLPTRGWELMIGAVAAYIGNHHQIALNNLSRKSVVRISLEFLGVLMVTYAIFVFDRSIRFPSVYALIPTVGTALIILFTTSSTGLGRLLGSKLLVGVGLISYSAYLWHVPLFVFARHRYVSEPGNEVYLALIIVSFVFAYLSWLLVEKPFRNRSIFGRKMIFRFAGLGSFLLLFIGVVGLTTNGFDSRTADNGITLKELDNKVRANFGLGAECDSNIRTPPACRTSDAPEILIWGDSFAMHLVDGILSSNSSAKIIQMTKARCNPFLGVSPVTATYGKGRAQDCIDFNNRVRKWLEENDSVKHVVLSSPFTIFLEEGVQLLGEDGQLRDMSLEEMTHSFIATLRAIENLGPSAVVFSPPPYSREERDIGFCLAKASMFNGDMEMCNFPANEVSDRSRDVYAFLSAVDSVYPVVWLNELICDQEVCRTSTGTTFLYQDKGHLTHEGSAEIGKAANFYKIITESKRADGQNQQGL